jgi:predicted ABC-type ATPase
VKRLDLVAGPNGAGKSTFVELTLAPLLRGSVFVNADEIAKHRWPDDAPTHAHEAALIAAEAR